MRPLVTIVTVLSLLLSQWLYAQEEPSPEGHHVEHQEEQQEEQAHYKHAISVEIGHLHLSEGVNNGEKQWLAVPLWAINYTYLINHQWAVGLHTDIIIENFEVVISSNDDGDEIETIERTRPVSFVGAVTYKPLHYLGFVAGVGIEYAPEETFTLIRIGLEPSFEISPKWEGVFSIVYDIKIDAYNNWGMGLGVARLF